jgi:hypothetical protein
MTSFPLLYWSPSGILCSVAGAESSSGGMPSLCGEQEEEKKETYSFAGTSLQIQTDRHNYPCKEIPASVGSSDLFAAQRDDFCGQLHVVCPGSIITPAALYLQSLPVERRLK